MTDVVSEITTLSSGFTIKNDMVIITDTAITVGTTDTTDNSVKWKGPL